MRALAMTGMETASMIPWTMSGSLIRAMPPWARMSAGTRWRAMTATAPASSAIFACSGVTTSMMTPPFSCSAMPRLTASVPVVGVVALRSSATGTASISDVGGLSMLRARATATGGAAGDLAQVVLDVEEARHRPGGVQPQQAGQSAGAQGGGVADGVVVEAPGQPDPGRRPVEVGPHRGRYAGQVGRQLAQLPAQGVLRELAVAGPGRADLADG